MIEIKKYCDYPILKKELWGKAIQTVEIIEENGKTGELIYLLAQLFTESNIHEINDFLSYEGEIVFKLIGIKDF